MTPLKYYLKFLSILLLLLFVNCINYYYNKTPLNITSNLTGIVISLLVYLKFKQNITD